jgi:hypothetical protein
MIKRIFILLLISCTLGSVSTAQLGLKQNKSTFFDDKPVTNTKKKRKRNFKLALTGTYFEANNTPVSLGGLSMELFIGRYMSLNYNLNFGIANTYKNHFYYHGTMGGSVGSLFLASAAITNVIDDELDEAFSTAFNTDFNLGKNVTSSLALAGLLMIIIPEGFNVNFDIGKSISLSPYYNPLGLDYCPDKEAFRNQLNLTWEYGAKLNFYFKNRRYLTPKVGIKNFYAYGYKGLQFSLAYGFYF